MNHLKEYSKLFVLPIERYIGLDSRIIVQQNFKSPVIYKCLKCCNPEALLYDSIRESVKGGVLNETLK